MTRIARFAAFTAMVVGLAACSSPVEPPTPKGFVNPNVNFVNPNVNFVNPNVNFVNPNV
jgi:putative hemolysin